jgi:hypothetical protein
MDYKGYNIAIHEFGHNVEQTISLYDVDHYTMSGVPNTAFTEALAFIYQTRDLELLGIQTNEPNVEYLNTLDKLWGSYEIMGVSLVDMAVWRWMYDNPDATQQHNSKKRPSALQRKCGTITLRPFLAKRIHPSLQFIPI